MSENIQKTSDEISINAEFHRKMMFSQTSSKSSSSSSSSFAKKSLSSSPSSSFAKKSLSSTSDTKPLKHTNSSFSMSSDLEDWSDPGVVEDWLAEDSEIIAENVFTFEAKDDHIIKNDVPTTPEDKFSVENREIYDGLLKVFDLRFSALSETTQLQLIENVTIIRCIPGQMIITEGDDSGDFYMVLGPRGAQVEVVKKVQGVDKLLTRLECGQYFGQKYFMTNRQTKRNATVRALTAVTLACVAPEQFSAWQQFRTYLLMKAVPLIRTLPENEQIEMYSLLQHQEFEDGEYIVRQGDIGDKFYIITDGAADVIEEMVTGFRRNRNVLTRLYEGHSFGELALIYDEPRVASVQAVGSTSCLYLSKVAFRQALSTTQFNEVMQEISYQRMVLREKREHQHSKLTNNSFSADSSISTLSEFDVDFDGAMRYSPSSMLPLSSPQLHHAGSMSSVTSSATALSVTTTNVLVRRRFSTGDKFINKFNIIREIGRGTFGEVYLARNEETNELVAIKSANRSTNKWTMSIANDIQTEIVIMQKLNHPNIVSLYEVIDDPSSKQVYLVMEFVEYGPILPDENIVTPLPPELSWLYFRDIVKGVMYLHSQGIVHRDIKPQNIFLGSDGHIKIGDFGGAVIIGKTTKAPLVGGSPSFMAPELFKMESSSGASGGIDPNAPQVDVWGMGATLYNMLFGQPPWMASNQLVLAEMVQNFELTFPDNKIPVDEWIHLKNLLKQMLEKDPKLRITLLSIMYHDWITKEGSHPLETDLDSLLADSPSYIRRISSKYSVANSVKSISDLGLPPASRDSLKRFTFADSSELAKNIQEFQKINENDQGSDRRYSSSSHGDHSFKTNDTIDVDYDNDFQPDMIYAVQAPSNSENSLACWRSGAEGEIANSSNGAYPEKTLQRTKDFVMVNTGTVMTKSGQMVKGFAISTSKTSQRSLRMHDLPAVIPSALRTENFSKATINSKMFKRSNTYSSDESADSHRSPIQKSRSLSRNFLKNERPKSLVHMVGTRDNASPMQHKDDLSIDAASHVSSSNSDDDDDDDESDVEDLEVLVEEETNMEVADNNSDSNSFSGNLSNKSLSNRSSKTSTIVSRSSGISTTSRLSNNSRVSMKNITSTRSFYHEEVDEKSSSDNDEEVMELDDDDLFGMLNDLAKPPLPSDKSTVELSPLHHLSMKGENSLFKVKPWPGQENSSLGIKYGLAENKNDRDYMEDRTTAKPRISGFLRRPSDTTSPPRLSISVDVESFDFAFFGIYDGHDGSYVAEYLKQNLHQRFEDKIKINGTDLDGYSKSLLEACEAIDREILRTDSARVEEAKVKRASAIMTVDSDDIAGCLLKDSSSKSFAGSTAVIAVLYSGNETFPHPVTPASPKISFWDNGKSNSSVKANGDTRDSIKSEEDSLQSSTIRMSPPQKHGEIKTQINLLIAHVGDCRAVLSDNGVAVQLTVDHKPNSVEERERIEKAGGQVIGGRVLSVLAVSRSFGDIMFKNTSMESLSGDTDIWNSDSQVISKPEILELAVLSSYEFLIIACDGLWDKMSCGEAVNFVRRRLVEHGDVQRAAKETITKVQNLGSIDNISVAVICLNQFAHHL